MAIMRIKIAFFISNGTSASQLIRDAFSESVTNSAKVQKSVLSKFIGETPPQPSLFLQKGLRVLCDYADSNTSIDQRKTLLSSLERQAETIDKNEEFHPGEINRILKYFTEHANPEGIKTADGTELLLRETYLARMGYDADERGILLNDANQQNTLRTIELHANEPDRMHQMLRDSINASISRLAEELGYSFPNS